jgi:hypothetical protein
MSVEVLTVCEWVGGIRRDTETTHPTWSDVEAAIRTLDNDRFNDLYLQPRQNAPETYLCVGGGGGRYVVSGSVENEAFPTVIDPAKADAPQELLVVGGCGSRDRTQRGPQLLRDWRAQRSRGLAAPPLIPNAAQPQAALTRRVSKHSGPHGRSAKCMGRSAFPHS